MIWNDIKGYEGLYQISESGEIRSLPRVVNTLIKNNKERLLKGRLLKQGNSSGYMIVSLSKNNITRTHLVHILVWDAFGNEPRGDRQVDHIREDKKLNHIGNLQLLTCRQNTIKRSLNRPKTSAHTGVSFKNENKKWIAYGYINGKRKYLGYFLTEIDAYNKIKEMEVEK